MYRLVHAWKTFRTKLSSRREGSSVTQRGGGGDGGRVVGEKEKKKELGSRLRFFTRKLLIKNKLFLRILAK